MDISKPPHCAPRLLTTLLACVCVTCAAEVRSQARAQSPRPATIIADVSLVPMDRDGVLPNQWVVIRDGRIVRIGPRSKVRVPADATVIEAAGKFLLPGLVDFHAHPRSDTELASYRQAGITRVAALGGEPLGWRAQTRRLLDDAPLPRIVASSRPFDGHPPLSRRFYALDTAGDVAVAVANEYRLGALVVKTYSKLSVPAPELIVQFPPQVRV